MKNALAHIGVYVSNLKESQRFYENILGFHKVWENTNASPEGDVKVVFVEKEGLIIELIKLPILEERRDGVIDHFAIAVKEIDQVIEASSLRMVAIVSHPMFLTKDQSG